VAPDAGEGSTSPTYRAIVAAVWGPVPSGTVAPMRMPNSASITRWTNRSEGSVAGESKVVDDSSRPKTGRSIFSASWAMGLVQATL